MAINDNTNKIGELINIINSLPVAGSGSGGSADGADKKILNVWWDNDAGRFSHTASEIINAANDGKVIILDGSPDLMFTGEDNGRAKFFHSYIDSYYNTIVSGYLYVLEDGSVENDIEGYLYTNTIPVFYMDQSNFAEALTENQLAYIGNTTYSTGGLTVISYNNRIYKFHHDDDYGMHFICTINEFGVRFTETISVSWDGVVTISSAAEQIIPVLSEPEGGEIPVMEIDGSVSWQKLDGQSSGVLNVRWDDGAGRYSHTASEIISAANDGKTIIVDNSLDVIFDGEVDGVAGFTYSYLTSENCIVKGYFYILDDGSYADDGYEHETNTVNVLYLRYAEGELNEEQFNYIMHGVWNNNGLAVISHNNEVYKFDSYDENNVYFVHTFCNTDTRYINTIAISTDGVISYFSRTEPIIPVLAEPEGGEVLTMSTSGNVSWEKPSTKTLTEMLMEEDLILNERHFGDELPDYGTPGRIFFLRKGAE